MFKRSFSKELYATELARVALEVSLRLSIRYMIAQVILSSNMLFSFDLREKPLEAADF